MEDTPKGGQSCRASYRPNPAQPAPSTRIAPHKTGLPSCWMLHKREMRRAEGAAPTAVPRMSRPVIPAQPRARRQRDSPAMAPTKDPGGSPGPGSRKAGPRGPEWPAKPPAGAKWPGRSGGPGLEYEGSTLGSILRVTPVLSLSFTTSTELAQTHVH